MIEWVPLALCDPPHDVKRPDQVIDLANALLDGWGIGQPALVGYNLYWRIQLLSGSHRYAAAKMAGLTLLPVTVRDYSLIRSAYGNVHEWLELMKPETVWTPTSPQEPS